MPFKNPERRKEYSKKWEKENKEKRKKYQRKYDRQLRNRVIEKLGGKCIYCGCDEKEALELNHLKGGGSSEYNKGYSAKMLHLDVLADRRNDIELTCGVCNARHKFKILKGITGDWTIKWNGVGRD